MKLLYLVGGSVQDCYSIASEHGIPSNKVVPIFDKEEAAKLRDVFIIVTSSQSPESIEIANIILKTPNTIILNENASEFISYFNKVLRESLDKANSAISINNAKNIIHQYLLDKLQLPHQNLNFSIGRSSSGIVIYSINDWTAGLMTLVNAH